MSSISRWAFATSNDTTAFVMKESLGLDEIGDIPVVSSNPISL
jgi:hypothetical protein